MIVLNDCFHWPTGTAYVGAFGIDCCTGNLVADASFGSECKVYYPK